MTDTVVGFIKTMSATKLALETNILNRVIGVVESSGRGPASEIIDLTFSITGYGEASVPGGESQVAGNCITALIKYLTLRAKGTNESLEECLLELITQSTRLYGEASTNTGTRVVPLQKKTG